MDGSDEGATLVEGIWLMLGVIDGDSEQYTSSPDLLDLDEPVLDDFQLLQDLDDLDDFSPDGLEDVLGMEEVLGSLEGALDVLGMEEVLGSAEGKLEMDGLGLPVGLLDDFDDFDDLLIFSPVSV